MSSTTIQHQQHTQALLPQKSQAAQSFHWITSREEKSAHSVLSSAVESSIARSNMIQECFNCKVTQTPLWRRSPDGNHLCNACGLYFKTHNSHRPIDWKATTIKRRRRRRQEFGVPAQYAHAAYQQQYSSAHYDDLHHPSSPSSTGSQGDAHHQSITTPPESPSFYQSHDQHSRKRLPSLSTIFHPSSGPKSASLPRNFSSHDRSHYQQQGTAPYHQHKRTRSQEFEQAQYGRPAACYTPSSQTFVKVGKHHNLPTLSLPSHQARKMSPYHSPLSSSFPSRAHSPCDPQSPLATDCVSRKSSTSALSDDTLPSLVSVLQGLVASVNNCKDTVTKSCPSSPVESHINRNVLPGASTSNYSQVSPIISKKPSIHSLLN